MAETTLKETRPSQWLNIWFFLGSAMLSVGVIVAGVYCPSEWGIFPLGYGLLVPILLWVVWRILVIRCQKYRLSTQRIHIVSGVLNQKIDEIELYRVKDVTMTRSFWMRILGLSSIHIKSSDRTLPNLIIPAIREGNEFRELLREQVEIIRDRKRVREMDFADTAGGFGDEMDLDDIDLGG